MGDVLFNVGQLTANVPRKDQKTGLNPEKENESRGFVEFELQLRAAKEMLWDARHNPVVKIQ